MALLHPAIAKQVQDTLNGKKSKGKPPPRAVTVFQGGPQRKGPPTPIKGPTVPVTGRVPGWHNLSPGGQDTHKTGLAPGRSTGPKATPLTQKKKAPTGAGGGAKPGAGAPTSSAASPFLTPGQEAARLKGESNYALKIAALQRAIGDATVNTNQGLYNSQHARDINTNVANQRMAAHGLFQSSIRDGELNDIDATMAIRNNLLNTNLQRLTINNLSNISGLQTNQGIDANMYNQLAVANAQALTPVLPTGVGAPPTPPTAAQGWHNVQSPGQDTHTTGQNPGAWNTGGQAGQDQTPSGWNTGGTKTGQDQISNRTVVTRGGG